MDTEKHGKLGPLIDLVYKVVLVEEALRNRQQSMALIIGPGLEGTSQDRNLGQLYSNFSVSEADKDEIICRFYKSALRSF